MQARFSADGDIRLLVGQDEVEHLRWMDRMASSNLDEVLAAFSDTRFSQLRIHSASDGNGIFLTAAFPPQAYIAVVRQGNDYDVRLSHGALDALLTGMCSHRYGASSKVTVYKGNTWEELADKFSL